ncbi:MAG: hypothetical protein FWD51_01895 [Betaproteobacteria bacterium]|nr:hypothetical protein [Betaproteobacteria bacterium]
MNTPLTHIFDFDMLDSFMTNFLNHAPIYCYHCGFYCYNILWLRSGTATTEFRTHIRFRAFAGGRKPGTVSKNARRTGKHAYIRPILPKHPGSRANILA